MAYHLDAVHSLCDFDFSEHVMPMRGLTGLGVIETEPWLLVPMECPLGFTCQPRVEKKDGGCPLRRCWADLPRNERDMVRKKYGVPITISMFEKEV